MKQQDKNQNQSQSTQHGNPAIFNFKEHWDTVLPHLPIVEAVLTREVEDDGLDPSRGPWWYSGTYWPDRALDEANAAADRGEFVWAKCGEDEEQSDAELERWFNFMDQFLPQPGTYQWYQGFGLGDLLAPWECELGRRLFPDLDWEVVGDVPWDSYACGFDSLGNPKMIFDILHFEKFETLVIPG